MQIRDRMAPGPIRAITDDSNHRRNHLTYRNNAEPDALQALVNRSDVIEVEGQLWLLAPVTPPILDELAGLDADREDLEDDDPGEPENLGNPCVEEPPLPVREVRS